MFYVKIIRPLFFLIDAETIHRRMVKGLKFVSAVAPARFVFKKFLLASDPRLRTRLGELTLPNPVGLAAGFDKDIEAPRAYQMLGFGFAELGSITWSPLAGNPKPRLWRIPADEGLIVNYGLANCGAEEAARRLAKARASGAGPLGVNIAPSTGLEPDAMLEDYLKTFSLLHHLTDYIALNVSCPNVASCEKFAQVSFIKELIIRVRNLMDERKIDKDVFIKIGPEFQLAELGEIVDCCAANQITGIIATNLIKDRAGVAPRSPARLLEHPGGISGRLLKEKSNETIRHIYRRAGDKLKIIGAGGIFTAEDAYEKIKCGASALQLMTGWIYGGPLIIRQINRGMIELLKRDGFANIDEAAGKGA